MFALNTPFSALPNSLTTPRVEVRQGCRLYQAVNVSPEILDATLVTAPRSLYDQSSAMQGLPYDTGLHGVLHGAEVWGKTIESGGHDNSYGMILSNGQDKLVHIEPMSASHPEASFKAKLAETLQPVSVTGHLRFPTMGGTTGEAGRRNAQPFYTNGLSMIHNGSMKGAFTPGVTREIHRWLPEQALKPDDSDSLRIFYYLRSQLVKHLKTDTVDQLPEEQVKRILVHSIQHIYDITPPTLSSVVQSARTLPVSGFYNDHKSNFIFDFKEVKLAIRHAAPLYLWGERTPKGDQFKSAILMTEPPNVPGMVWSELADNTAFTLSKQGKEVYDANMVPLGMVPKPSLPVSRYPLVALYGLQDVVLGGIDKVKQLVGKLTSVFRKSEPPAVLTPLPLPTA